MNTDPKTLAYINMYGVLGALTALCDHVPEAKKILGSAGCSIGFAVKDGPSATLTFVGGKCILKEGVEDCTVKIPFSSAEKFNGMVDGTVTPVPVKGFTRLPFLLGKFKKLTDLLESYLRPSPEKLEDEEFLRLLTSAEEEVEIILEDRIPRSLFNYGELSILAIRTYRVMKFFQMITLSEFLTLIPTNH